MSLDQTSTTTREHLGARERSESHLKGPVLVQARIAWVVLTLLALGLYAANLPSYSAALHGGSALPGGPQLAPADLHTLQGLGLSLDSYAWFVISVNAIVLLGYVVVGVILFWRASRGNAYEILASRRLEGKEVFKRGVIAESGAASGFWV